MSAIIKQDIVTIFDRGASHSHADGADSASISIYELSKNLEAFSKTLKTLVPVITDAGGGFRLQTMEVAVGIDGQGHVGFLATGSDVRAKATITMTFSRSADPPDARLQVTLASTL